MLRISILFTLMLSVAAALACSGGVPAGNVTQNSNAAANDAPNNSAPDAPAPLATPSKEFTEADIAKLKWLEGSWKGMDKDKPFFERISFEGPAMIVQTYTDGTMSTVKDTSRFELKDGEFATSVGESRSAASSITENAVQFVPAAAPNSDLARAKGFTFRFQRAADGKKWYAVLATPPKGNQPAGEVTYTMEPWQPQAGKPAK